MEGGGGRERNINVLVASHVPPTGDLPPNPAGLHLCSFFLSVTLVRDVILIMLHMGTWTFTQVKKLVPSHTVLEMKAKPQPADSGRCHYSTAVSVL